MSKHRDDILFKQDTFLEGIEIPQPCSSLDDEPEITVVFEPEVESIEISQQQVSWIAALFLMSCFILFFGGYKLGKAHSVQIGSLPEENYFTNPAFDETRINTKHCTGDRFALFADALVRYHDLTKQGKKAYIIKKTSRSLAGLERLWYHVSEIDTEIKSER